MAVKAYDLRSTVPSVWLVGLYTPLGVDLAEGAHPHMGVIQ